MADSSEPAFLFLYRKGAVAPVDYLSTFATAPSPPFWPRPDLRSCGPLRTAPAIHPPAPRCRAGVLWRIHNPMAYRAYP